EIVSPSLYYMRATPYFETASEKYNFLNLLASVAYGHRLATGPIYSVFEIVYRTAIATIRTNGLRFDMLVGLSARPEPRPFFHPTGSKNTPAIKPRQAAPAPLNSAVHSAHGR